VILSERWLLGALLNNPSVAETVRGELAPDHFTDPLHRILITAAYAQYDQYGKVDGKALAAQVPPEAQNLLSALLLQEGQVQEYTAVEVLIKEIRVRADEARLAEIGRRFQENPLDPAELARLGEEWRRLQESIRQYREELGGYTLPTPEDTP
jgi:replicative DNA helicase